jgi:hypothetical protein
LANFEGKLYAFTRASVFEIVDNPGQPLQGRLVTGGRGAVAPSSIRPTGFGALVWLSTAGFQALRGGEIVDISEDILPTIQKLNPARLSLACAAWSPETREYLCAVPESGDLYNHLVLVYDGRGWRRRKYGVHFTDMATTRDERGLVLACGGFTGGGQADHVWVLDREVRTYTPPTKTYLFQSGWLRMDPTGRDPFNVSTVFVGLLESSATQLTWRVYKNGRRDVAATSSTATSALSMTAPDVTEHVSNGVLGTLKVRTPRLFWKRFDVKLTGVDSFAFDLEGSEGSGQFPQIAAFAFEGVFVNNAGSRAFRG